MAGDLDSGLLGGELLTVLFRCNGLWHGLVPHPEVTQIEVSVVSSFLAQSVEGGPNAGLLICEQLAVPFCGGSRWQSLPFLLEIGGVEMSAADSWPAKCGR